MRGIAKMEVAPIKCQEYLGHEGMKFSRFGIDVKKTAPESAV
jgi:hypothetical protein